MTPSGASLLPPTVGLAPVLLAVDQSALRRLVERHASGVDAAGAQVEEALLELAEGLAREFVASLEGATPSGIRQRILAMQLSDALDLIDDVRSQDGTSLMDSARERWFDRLHEFADLARETAGATGVPIERLDVEAWAQIQEGGLVNAASTWDTSVKRNLGDGLLRAANEALYAKPGVVGQRITDMVRALTPGAVAESITATAIYDRSISAGIVADVDPDGDLRWCYSGPDDGITRPFCAVASGHSFTRDQVADLNNGQGIPVADGCGGWRCRHRWLFLPAKSAVRFGYDAATVLTVKRANLVAAGGGRKGRR